MLLNFAYYHGFQGWSVQYTAYFSACEQGVLTIKLQKYAPYLLIGGYFSECRCENIHQKHLECFLNADPWAFPLYPTLPSPT